MCNKFTQEMWSNLNSMQADGLVIIENGEVEITEKGRQALQTATTKGNDDNV